MNSQNMKSRKLKHIKGVFWESESGERVVLSPLTGSDQIFKDDTWYYVLSNGVCAVSSVEV
jgi:hypothetical protein